MPLYEYQCDVCRRQFELIRKFSDPPLEKCPTCGGTVRKLMSSPAFQFKGSGWYITDYAKKEQAPGSKPEDSKSEAASKDTDKGEKSEKSEKTEKTESKPETKTSTDSTPAAAATKKD